MTCRASGEETRAFGKTENEAKRKAAHLMMQLLRNSGSDSSIKEYEDIPSTEEAVRFFEENLKSKKGKKMELPINDARSVFNLFAQQFPEMVKVNGLGKNDHKFSGSDHCRNVAFSTLFHISN